MNKNKEAFSVVPTVEYRKPQEKKPEEILHHLFNGNITKKNLTAMISLPEANIIAETKLKGVYENKGVQIQGTLSDVENTEKIGSILMNIYKNPKGELEIFIEERELKNQGSGLGLDLECQIEKFCRENKISSIYNEASTLPDLRFIGAYVWARYGYEFRFKRDKKRMEKHITEFAQNNNLKIEGDLGKHERPSDFAKVKGVDSQGKECNIGKRALTESEFCWLGHRDVSLESQGTKDFVEYLEFRNRTDLINEYYPGLSEN